MTRALASIGAAGSVRTMAHPTFATETVVDPVTGGCSPEGWGGLGITGCWPNEAHLLEGDSGLGIEGHGGLR